MASCGGKYKITGKTNLIPDGETILLQKQNNEQFEIVDSATVTNGSFSFKGEQKSPAIAILVHLNDKQSQIPPQLIALGEGDIYVTLDSVSHISGTPLNDRLRMYETKRRSYDTRIRNITNRYLKDYLSDFQIFEMSVGARFDSYFSVHPCYIFFVLFLRMHLQNMYQLVCNYHQKTNYPL